MTRCIALIMILACLSVGLAGCGETLNGIVTDTKRIGRGAHTVIFRED
jgi:predicted small secreted protein